MDFFEQLRIYENLAMKQGNGVALIMISNLKRDMRELRRNLLEAIREGNANETMPDR